MSMNVFWALIYKDDNGFYPEGQQRMLSCKCVKVIEEGITTEGVIVSLPGATQVPGTADTTDLESGSVMVPKNTVLPPDTFADSSFKNVTRIKDNETGITTWVDTDSYNANVVTCFPTS